MQGLRLESGWTANEHRETFWDDRNFVRPECGDGCTTTYIYQNSLNYKHKIDEYYGM